MLRLLASSSASPLLNPLARAAALMQRRSYSPSTPSLGRSHKIVGKKGVADQARSQIFIKLSKEITNASSACGGDMTNMKLLSIISKAKKANMLKDTIKKAVDKGAGAKTATDLTIIRYDGVVKLPSSDVVSFIIMCETDSKNRAGAQVRHTFSKRGGELQKTGVLDFVFKEVSEVTVRSSLPAEEEWDDAVMDAALEAGADDVEFEETTDDDGNPDKRKAVITCPIPDAKTIAAAISSFDVDAEADIQILYKTTDASNNIELGETDEEAWAALDAVIEAFEDCEDVTDVYHNAV
jgi:transcriptional/translational regulatory protein YebC/TACO1